MVFKRKTLEDVKLRDRIPEEMRKSKAYEKLFGHFYQYFYIDYYWEGDIPIVIEYPASESIYEIPRNPEEKNPGEEIHNTPKGIKAVAHLFKMMLFEILLRLFGGRRVNLASILACPTCKIDLNHGHSEVLLCNYCNIMYPVVRAIPILLMAKAKPLEH